MTFEEDYPSLVGKECYASGYVCFLKDDVVMNCLDKTKVRQAIERVKMEGSWKAFLDLANDVGLKDE